MPNWCGNSLVLKHDNPEMIARAYKAFVDGRFCDEFVPMPDLLRDSVSPPRDEKYSQELVEKFGYTDWYSFSVAEWGTKWDFGHGDGINEVTDSSLTVYFDSAWSPPIAMMEKLEDLGFEVDLMYDEPGMAFCGRYTAGSDECYEYGDMTADEIDIEIPGDINEAFNIAENKRMWEEENEDES